MARTDNVTRLRRRILLGAAALLAVLLLLWLRWNVELGMLLEMAGGALLFVALATLAGVAGGVLLRLARRGSGG